MYWIPTMLILSVYAIVQYIARTKGDWDDRVKLRAQARSPVQLLQLSSFLPPFHFTLYSFPIPSTPAAVAGSPRLLAQRCGAARRRSAQAARRAQRRMRT